ncbi:MAG: hypothetical protein H6662_11225 [Ardenticatenaceae bacterium]|nr:hypothetical protein [Anaerolineales bacterium]MCB8922145.1 hypothetical protein [Ardenticatenaceae bacterium]MCB8991125.1 hypothetical protein [Ardenticatenaceae bacterium]MCB9005281.1 hypothetical protein [Ardenticatenaceae bacterium]
MNKPHALFTLLLLLLAGCTGPAPQSVADLPTRAATAVPLPTALPTNTAVPIPPTFTPVPTALPSDTPTVTPIPTATATATAVPTSTAVPYGYSTILGYSAGGHPITAYQLGNGPDQVLFIGGIHGGYEWNSILVTYRALDYFLENPDAIPANITLTIIPAANPDGQFAVTGLEGRFTAADVATDTFPGRFNANNVDLNRNWDCNWEPTGLWRNQEVSAGAYPFSEPENVILRDFILAKNPVATIFYHSAFYAVFTAGCPDTLPASREIADVYAYAANYPVYEQFTSYPITGDAGDWLATQGIASFTVELTNHTDLDWPQNLYGMLALLDYFAQE